MTHLERLILAFLSGMVLTILAIIVVQKALKSSPALCKAQTVIVCKTDGPSVAECGKLYSEILKRRNPQ